MARYVKGALVRCLDRYGREVARGVTNEVGRVVLRGIPPGTYTLKVLTPGLFEVECQIERLRADGEVFVFILAHELLKRAQIGPDETLGEKVWEGVTPNVKETLGEKVWGELA